MDTLQITLFGQISVVHPNHTAPLKISRNLQYFLAYLLLQHHLVPREVLMEVFWVDDPPERARSSLTTALWRLRQVLEPHGVSTGTYLVASNAGEVGFNWDSSHWLDTESFESHVCPFLRKSLSVLTEDDIKRLEGILPLYRGELLEGSYEDWALRERERFRSLYFTCLTRLMTYYTSHNNFEKSIAYGHDILQLDPLREEIHRDLMHVYLQCGQRALAIRQYTLCRELLSRELGVSPLAETEILYQQIIESSCSASAADGGELTPEIAYLLNEFQLVKRALEETTKRLVRITQSVNRIIGEAGPKNSIEQKH